MISIPARTPGRLLFAASRDVIAWRTPRQAWMMFKPPWNRPLFSERNGYWTVLWSWRGFRLLRDPAGA